MEMIFNKKRNIGAPLHGPLYVLPVFIASCSYVWAANTDTIIASGTQRTLENLTLENGTNGTFIVQAKSNADITATHIVLNSSGIHGGGAWIDSSKFTADDLLVNVTGNSGTGVYLANNSTATISNLTVKGQGSALGMELDGAWSSAQGHATAQLVDSSLDTESGVAIRVSAGDLTLNNVSASTTGNSSYAVNANSSANVAIEGGTFSTQGDYSDAIWVVSQDSSVNVNNATVNTAGDRAHAVNAQKGTSEVTNSTLTTQGENAYGLYTENQIQGDNLTITTSGIGGAGLFTALGGTGTLTNSSITTHGELAPGLLAYPGSQITADSVQIETTGGEGFGLWSRAGTLNISNSEITTGGEKASGLYVNGYSSTASLTNNVSLNNVVLSPAQAQAVEVDTTYLTLNVTDSTLTGGNGQLMTVSHYEDSLDPANNLYSNVTLNATNDVLNGDISVSDPKNSVAVNLNSGSVLTGAVNNATSLTLDASSSWNLNNNSSVGQLTNNGTVTFSDQAKFDTLTVTGDYAGDGGVLVMNSVLGDDSSSTNKLIVGGNVQQGTTRVTINNLGGHGAQTVEGIEIVDVGGKSLGSFIKSGRIVAGAYDYDIVKKGESWYLTSQQTPDDQTPGLDPGATPVIRPQTKMPPAIRPEGGSYTANLAAANSMFMMTLHDRLGETQFIDAITGQPEVTSLWLRQVGGHQVWRDGSGQLKTQSNSYVAQMGGDVARWSTDGTNRWHVGFMAGYGNDQNTTGSQWNGYSSKGSVKGYNVGTYATWYANGDNHTGAWVDSWLMYSWFNNDVSGQDLATESYKSHGITASLESGYTWKTGQFQGGHSTVNEWFVQPQAQVVWMGVRADDHREVNGTRVNSEGNANWLTRLGVKTWIKGHHALDNDKRREFQPFMTLSWLHNTRNYTTRMDDIRVSQDGATNLAEVKVGVEGQLDPRLNLWGNVGVQVGDAGYNNTTAMFGVKYNF
ncbi:autotransporter outer membrane beta-barrel domain-containing protein [Erwinia sp. CPCC 100877]|nr:autotransporter outer membrane beta-barrel domain-containing protein [Erwinia sp. CPCC 100877]